MKLKTSDKNAKESTSAVSKAAATKEQKKSSAAAIKTEHVFNYHSYKLVETELHTIFDKCEEPAWLNLLLIENSKDYHTNKINTHAIMISKSFEKWHFKQTVKSKFDFDLQLNALKVATKHHTLLLESIVKSYDLCNVEKTKLYDHVIFEIEKFDYKDKALCISFLAMQDFFDIKTVCLKKF